MINKHVLLLIFSLIAINSMAQNVDFLLLNLWESKSVVKSNFEDLGFEFHDQVSNEYCSSIIMLKGNERLTLNFCSASSDSLTNLVLQSRDVEIISQLKSEMNKVDGFELERKFIAGYTSFVYSDSFDYEISFVKISDHNLFSITVSSYPTFQEFKEHMETGLKYEESKDPIHLFWKLLTIKNSNGELLEDKLNSIIQFPYDQSTDLANSIDKYRTENSFVKMKEIVDKEFIDDEKTVLKMKEQLAEIRTLVMGYNPNHETQQKMMIEMAIDNQLYGSLLVMDYLCEKLDAK